MDPVAMALRIILITIACSAFILLLIALVRAARNPSKAMRSFGAALMLFGWGNLRDPRNDTVAEAQDGRVRRGDESGDPPTTPP
jgi:hypothetical protein